MFICKFCGKEFDKNFAWSRHEKYYCKQNLDRLPIKAGSRYLEHHKQNCKYCGRLIDVANIARHEAAHINPNSLKYHGNSTHLDHDDLNCKYCNKLCKNKKSLAQHEIRCSKNPERKDFNKLEKYITNFRKGKTAEDLPEIAKASESLKRRYRDHTLTSYFKVNSIWKGRHHSEETKEKKRYAMLKRRETLGEKTRVSYNPSGCIYAEYLNSIYNWNLQHAENGGEICIGGYFLDGYDKNLNIAFEYDEPQHYENVTANILKPKDINRMKFIINKIHCRFIRYNEKLQLLYEIDENLNIKQL